MDRERLGRALGYGTRHAAKTLAAVAEAAVAPDPRRPAGPSAGTGDFPAASPAAATSPAATSSRSSARHSPSSSRRVPSSQQLRTAGRSFWGPLAAFSGALWLRVTGVFFAVIALAMANGAWRVRSSLHAFPSSAGSTDRQHFWLFASFAVLFAYFAVSSFVRATLRERRSARPGPSAPAPRQR